MDRYPIANRAIRDVLVHYLAERAALSTTARWSTRSQALADLFWCDLERHHPGIASLHLPDEVAAEWKQRVRVLPDGRPRRNAHAVVLAVRSFYLDLRQWSLEDPARWAEWAAPCPIRESDVPASEGDPAAAGADAGTHPHPGPGAAPPRPPPRRTELAVAEQLLAAVRKARPGERIRHRRPPVRRPGRETSNWRPSALFVAPLDESCRPGTRFDAERREEKRVLDLGGDGGPAPHRRPDRGTARTDPPQPAPVPGTNRRDGAAAADQPVQDRPRTGPARRPGPGRRAGPDHPPHQERGRQGAAVDAATTPTSGPSVRRCRTCSSAPRGTARKSSEPGSGPRTPGRAGQTAPTSSTSTARR